MGEWVIVNAGWYKCRLGSVPAGAEELAIGLGGNGTASHASKPSPACSIRLIS